MMFDLLSLDKKLGSIPLLLLYPALILAPNGRRRYLQRREGIQFLVPLHCDVFKAANIPGVQYPFWTGSRLFGFILRLYLLCVSFLQLGSNELISDFVHRDEPWLGSHCVSTTLHSTLFTVFNFVYPWVISSTVDCFEFNKKKNSFNFRFQSLHTIHNGNIVNDKRSTVQILALTVGKLKTLLFC